MDSKQNNNKLNSKVSDVSKKDSKAKHKDNDGREGTTSKNERDHSEVQEATNQQNNPENLNESVNDLSFIQGIESQRLVVQPRNPNLRITQELEDEDNFDYAYSSHPNTQDVNEFKGSRMRDNNRLSSSELSGDNFSSKDLSFSFNPNGFTFSAMQESALELEQYGRHGVENMSSNLGKRQLSQSSIIMPSTKYSHSDGIDEGSGDELVIELTEDEQDSIYPTSSATEATSGKARSSRNQTSYDENYRGRSDSRLSIESMELMDLCSKACTTQQTKQMTDGTIFEGFYKPCDSDLDNLLEYGYGEGWHEFRDLCIDIIQHKFDPEYNKSRFKVEMISLDDICGMMPNTRPKNIGGSKETVDFNGFKKNDDSCFDELINNMGSSSDSDPELQFSTDSNDTKYLDLSLGSDSSFHFEFTSEDQNSNDITKFYDYAIHSHYTEEVNPKDYAEFFDSSKDV